MNENIVSVEKCCCCLDSVKDNIYNLPAEHNGGGNDKAQRDYTNIKQRGVFIQSNKENRCHFISVMEKEEWKDRLLCFFFVSLLFF